MPTVLIKFCCLKNRNAHCIGQKDELSLLFFIPEFYKTKLLGIVVVLLGIKANKFVYHIWKHILRSLRFYLINLYYRIFCPDNEIYFSLINLIYHLTWNYHSFDWIYINALTYMAFIYSLLNRLLLLLWYGKRWKFAFLHHIM